MPTVDTPHGAIAYAVQGRGTPMVLIRGLGRTAKHWLGYEKELARHFKVVTIDSRGMGLSTRALGWNASIWEMADDVASVLAQEGIAQAHVVGVSLGGMIALAAAVRHPERCLSIVTINTSIGLTLPWQLQRASIFAWYAMARGALTDRERLEEFLLPLLIGVECSVERKAEILRLHNEILKADGVNVFGVVKQLLAAARFKPAAQLRAVKVPTMVVYGSHDRFVPRRNSIKLKELIPDARLVEIKGAGHEVALDKGPELLVLLQEWSREVAPSRGKGGKKKQAAVTQATGESA